MAPKQKHILKPPFKRLYLEITRVLPYVRTLPTKSRAAPDSISIWKRVSKSSGFTPCTSRRYDLNRENTTSIANQFIMMKFDLQWAGKEYRE